MTGPRWLASLAVLSVLTVASTLSAQTKRETPTGTKAPGPTGTKSQSSSDPVTVDADRMDRFGKESLVIFTGKVVARQNNSVQYADRMEVYLDEKEDRILRTVSTGNVKIITRTCRIGTAERAEYFDLEQRVVLIGNARVVQDNDVVTGDTITIYLSQDRSIAVANDQERVKGVFSPKGEKKDGAGSRDPSNPKRSATCTS